MKNVQCEKTSPMELPEDEKSLMTCLPILTRSYYEL